ncbi:DUF4221 family protein [Algoriphagus zhangzhouensis]|uniref:TolB-like 6-blade propeller-like n=1 Tax=Algoriphagus zhangzhouensis TaxID=1073327 RepID=A0A1M7ZAF9_9BACT|nr:DUF4221 family protein [Algoriphagus zhangzhouensis]TDY47234.1 uncharacterized protein DUF4221 [Algoriphagus zhangzhouensis]SHO61792.1 protein of unknown function [Algoriphagus zhangzhouensis]
MKSRIFFLLSLLIAAACSSPETNEENVLPDLELDIQDSIQVDYIGLLNLMDVNPQRKSILLFDPQKMQFVISDFEGKIISEFKKERDAPDGFGFYPMAAGKFNDQGNIIIVSPQGIFEYDIEGNLQESKRVPRDEQLPFSGRFDALKEIQFVENKILLSGLIARGDFNKTKPEFYDNFLQLVWADPETGKFEQFLHLDSASIFQNNMSHEPGTLSANFAVNGNQLFVITGSDPFLNILNINPPYQKQTRIALDLPNYKLNKGEDPKKADPQAISFDPSFGIINKMAKLDNMLFISYENGYDDLDALAYQEIKSQEEWGEYNERIGKKYKTHYLVLDLEGNKLADFESPDQLNKVFVSREGSLWFISKPNPDVEEDFVKIYKVDVD